MFRRNLTTAWWVPVESGATGSGIPDQFFTFPRGVVGWLELKTCSGWAVPLRPEQISWHLRYARMGGRSFVAVLRGDTLYIWPGRDSAQISKPGGMRAVAPAIIQAGGPKSWDWSAVELVLKS
jgi:hypothetical protein